MSEMWGTRGAVLVLGVLLTVGVLALPAGAFTSDTVPTLDVRLAIGEDGVVRVRETVTYDFAGGGEHGIVRRVPYRKGRRLYEVRHIRSGSSTGAPARADTLRLSNVVRIKLGDGRRTVSGRQAYVIEYEVAGAFTRYPDRDEFVWDAVGDSWEVPIGEAAVRVEGPVPLRKVSCRAGRPPAVTRCARHRDGLFAVDFTQSGLRPREGMLVRVRLPKGSVAISPPRYARPHWTGTWGGPVVLALALAVLGLVARRRELGRGAGPFLVTAGLTLTAADVGAEVLADGPWEYSLGDMSVTGVALSVVGAAVAYVHRSGASDNATVNWR